MSAITTNTGSYAGGMYIGKPDELSRLLEIQGEDEAKRLDTAGSDDEILSKEDKKKAQAAFERWLNSPEYEVTISEKARMKAELSGYLTQSPEEIEDIRDRSQYQYVTTNMGFTTNKYGYAGIMEKAARPYSEYKSSETLAESLSNMDKKYHELIKQIDDEYSGDEADKRRAELKDNYRAVLEDIYKNASSTNDRTRGYVESQERWDSLIDTYAKDEHKASAKSSADFSRLYEECDEANEILKELSDVVLYKWGRDFDPDEDIHGIKDKLIAYQNKTQEVYDTIDRSNGLDPEKHRQEQIAAIKTEISKGTGVYKYEDNAFENDYDAILESQTKKFSSTFRYHTTRQNESAPFAISDVHFDDIDKLKDTYQRLCDGISKSDEPDDKKNARFKELNAALMNTVRKNFLQPIQKSASARMNASYDSMRSVISSLNSVSKWDASKVLSGDELKNTLSDIVERYLDSHR